MRTYRHKPIGTVPRARELRKTASQPERRLLRALRQAFPDLKWRHQTPVGGFYADILCFSERLVIEVDGDTHANTADYDARRTSKIENEGYNVIRTSNPDVMQNLEGVLTQISLSFQEREGAHAKHGKGEDSIEGSDCDVPGTTLPSPFRALTGAPSLSQQERERKDRP